ncbi:hypothetical protein BD779DRAFT_1473370 [Infundibulicybe gibba]|nr:hypothetical protein BD779DRAFT_1473370 [Infundibulicybe gibba]
MDRTVSACPSANESRNHWEQNNSRACATYTSVQYPPNNSGRMKKLHRRNSQGLVLAFPVTPRAPPEHANSYHSILIAEIGNNCDRYHDRAARYMKDADLHTGSALIVTLKCLWDGMRK